MNEPFDLPVTYKGEEILFPAQLLQFGYTHKFAVRVNGEDILFEPDEERNYRAVVDASFLEGGKNVDIELLKAIAGAIESINLL